MTRNGKIARLPAPIRDDLNQRLENSQEGPKLLAWLNALPQVRDILQAAFEGAPVSKQNLSEWRQGGFREWQLRHEFMAEAAQLSDAAGELAGAVDTSSLPGALAGSLAARYAAVVNTWDGEPNAKIEGQLRLLRGLNRDIAVLQKTLQADRRQKAELEQANLDEDRRETEEMKTRFLNLLCCGSERAALAESFGGGERGKKLAHMVTAIKYDLPVWMDKAVMEPSSQTESKPVQPSPAEPPPAPVQQPSPPESVPSSPSLPSPSSLPSISSPTQSNPVKPVKTVSQLMEEHWARVRNESSAPTEEDLNIAHDNDEHRGKFDEPASV